jgi:hypothetical protein
MEISWHPALLALRLLLHLELRFVVSLHTLVFPFRKIYNAPLMLPMPLKLLLLSLNFDLNHHYHGTSPSIIP